MKEINDLLRREIAEHGPISMARFMEVALYCPNLGYYERDPGVIGFRGDFYTAPSIGPIFGQLLAGQFACWLNHLVKVPWHFVEAGAHDGTLAATILNWLGKNRPATLERLTYWIIEPSTKRRSWQQRKLEALAGKIQWVESLAELGSGSSGARLHGVIFSNEFLDAFPIHRAQWDASARTWFECGVTLQGDRFTFARLSQPMIDIPAELAQAGFQIPHQLAEVLPDRYTIDLSPAARQWWKEAAQILVSGKLMAIDYGGTTDELLIPERTSGTLRAYYKQRICDDPLAQPGDQDLTAHVNFTQLQRVGEAAGLQTDLAGSNVNAARDAQSAAVLSDERAKQIPAAAGSAGRPLWSQEEFFSNLIKNAAADQWSRPDIRQFQQLTHPAQMGRPFRVLVQSRRE